MSAASKKKYFEDIAGGSTKPTDVRESGPTAPSAGSDRKLATVAAKETDRQFSAASSPMETTKPACCPSQTTFILRLPDSKRKN